MDSVLLSCSTLLQGWRTRMFPRGIGICAGLCTFPLMLWSVMMIFSFSLIRLVSVWVSEIFLIILVFTLLDFDVIAGSVRTFQSFFVGTRLTWRTGKLRPSKSHSTGRKICSTTRFRPSQTTTLRSRSSTSPGSLQGKLYFVFYKRWVNI